MFEQKIRFLDTLGLLSSFTNLELQQLKFSSQNFVVEVKKRGSGRDSPQHGLSLDMFKDFI